MSEAPIYKHVRKDGRYVTIDTRTGQEVGPFEGEYKPVGDFFRSHLQKAKTTLQVGLSDLANLPGDVLPHLIYSDTAVDEKGRPLTKAQAGEHNYNREERIKGILKDSPATSSKTPPTAKPPVSSSGNVTRIGGKEYDLSDPTQKAAYDKVIAADRASRPGQKMADIRGGGGLKPDGSGRFAPAPDGNGSTGTRTSHSPVTMEFVNATMLQRGGLGGKDYKVENPFSSTQLPATSASNYFQKNPDYDFSKVLPEDMYSDVDLKLASNAFDAGSGVEFGSNLPQFPASGQIEYLQKDGAPLTVSSGTFKVTESNEAAQEPEINKIPPKPRGGRQLQNWENKYERKVRGAEMAAEREKSELEKNFKPDLERRKAFLDDDLNSMEALRAIEGQQGIVMHKNQYYHVNPNAGQEGESDYKDITLKERNTIMRGGEGAQKLRDSWVTGIVESTKKPDDEEDNK